MTLYTIATVSVLFCLCYTWMKKKYSYWLSKGVKGPTPLPVIGNFLTVMMFKESPYGWAKRIYNEFPNEDVVGVYRAFKPAIILRDPDLIKQIFIKDFVSFQDRGIKNSDDSLSDNLFASEGETWRILRQKLTPIFTSGKIKGMIPLIEKCADEFIKYVDGLVEHGIEHEIRSLASKYTLEVIGSTAFGVDMDAFSEKQNVFRDIAKKIFSPSFTSRITQFVDIIIPGVLRLKDSLNLPNGDRDRLKQFFMGLVNKIVQEREGKPKLRKDLMDLMIELKEQGTVMRREKDKLSQLEMTDSLIAAQALIFFAAGFETSSATMSFLIHELVLNQEIQDRIYREICGVENKYGKITYESLSEMQYLEMALDETLRKYPVASMLIRKANANYEFPGSKLILERGTSVMIPVNGLHHDPKYYKNPEVFDPERFSAENKGKIPQCAYLPFGEGPRHCIGMRFAKVQSMFGIIALIKTFKMEPSIKTKNNLTFNPKALTLTSDKGIWANISRR